MENEFKLNDQTNPLLEWLEKMAEQSHKEARDPLRIGNTAQLFWEGRFHAFLDVINCVKTSDYRTTTKG